MLDQAKKALCPSVASLKEMIDYISSLNWQRKHYRYSYAFSEPIMQCPRLDRFRYESGTVSSYARTWVKRGSVQGRSGCCYVPSGCCKLFCMWFCSSVSLLLCSRAVSLLSCHRPHVPDFFWFQMRNEMAKLVQKDVWNKEPLPQESECKNGIKDLVMWIVSDISAQD